MLAAMQNFSLALTLAEWEGALALMLLIKELGDKGGRFDKGDDNRLVAGELSISPFPVFAGEFSDNPSHSPRFLLDGRRRRRHNS